MRKMLVAWAALMVVLVASSPVGAVNGPLDGNAHPNVGVMVVTNANGDWIQFCGGVLISPTHFLTNFNCPQAVADAQNDGGRAEITFDQVAWPPEEAKWRTVKAGYVHPLANIPTIGRNEYGIAVLAKPVRGIAPAVLPTLDLLGSVDEGELLTVVGYGTGLAERRSATVTIFQVFPDVISVLNNTNATGQGGACGDGGAPYFLADTNIVVGVADGETGQCNAISWAHRNDIEAARSFLDDFVSVP